MWDWIAVVAGAVVAGAFALFFWWEVKHAMDYPFDDEM